MADLSTAIIAFVGVFAGGYVSSFLGEDFRRFRDSQALAGALAGELKSHDSAYDILSTSLAAMKTLAAKAQPLPLTEWPIPSSPVFEANVEKLGLLGPEMAEDLAFTYEQIRAFRFAFHQLSKHHERMPPEWNESMIQSAIDRSKAAHERGQKLVEKLEAHAKKHRYVSRIGYVILPIVLIAAAGYLLVTLHQASDAKTQCTTTLERGELRTTCK